MTQLLLVFLLIYFSQIFCNMDYTCLPDIHPSPGVSLPRGDTEVKVGSSFFPLTCHLNPNHPLYLSGVRSKDLAFLTNSSIIKSTIMNETSIQSMFHPSVEGVTDVSCVILPDNSIAQPQNTGVCTQKILVGHPPQDITKFSCVSDNWHSLNCTWTEPHNSVPTSYDVHFRTPGRKSAFKRCPSIPDIENLLKQSIPSTLRMCYLNFQTTPHYRQTTKKFDFYFNATNSINPRGVVTKHPVDHFSIVRPGPATDLLLYSPEPERLSARWNISREMVHFPPGLRQIVRYRGEWDQGSWTQVDTSNLVSSRDFFLLDLPDLSPPYTLYTVEVSMISDLPSSPPSLHSIPVQASLHTKPSPPARPPKTCMASFEMVGSGSAQTVLVYWQLLHEREHHGPDFTYQVTSVLEEGSSLPLLPVKQTQSYAEFESLSPSKTYSFSIVSLNSVGVSPFAATVLVPPVTVTTSLLPRSVTKIYQDEGIFILSWLPPHSETKVTSYTLFWCLASSGLDRPYQCEGYLDWKTITTDKLAGSLSHELVLPDVSAVYQLAVAANTDTISSGVQWSTCTVKNERGRATQVTDVVVDSVGARSVVVRWRLDCSRITGMVNSFLLEWCMVGGAGGVCQGKEVAAGFDYSDIDSLVPHTKYSFTVRVENALPGSLVQTSKQGPPSPPITVRTLPAPPGSPPSSISVASVSSIQATLKWDKPIQPNGEISKYLVHLTNIDTLDQETLETVDTDIVLSLTSYTRYLVSVTACTHTSPRSGDLCSQYRAEHSFTTLVGTPGQPSILGVRLVNSSSVEVEWDTQFQLGAKSIAKWGVMVARGEGEEPFLTFIRGGVTRSSFNLEMIRNTQGWGPDCTNSSVYREFYYFSLRAEVINSEGELFVGPWSTEQEQAVYCTPPLPWVLIVLVATLLPVSLLCMCGMVYGSCTWYTEKLAMIKKIQGGLDSRDIPPVVGQNIVPLQAEYELDQVFPNTEDYLDSDLDDCQGRVLLRTHKNSSSSSQDSGVSSQAPSSPTRQTNSGVPSVVSGYISMGATSVPQSPVSLLGKNPIPGGSPQGVPDLGYSRVGHLDTSNSYVPFTAIRPVQIDSSPGYISLGQVSELMLQPEQATAAYSRVGVLGHGSKHRLDLSIAGVTRLEEEVTSAEISKVKPTRPSLDNKVVSFSRENRDFTFV